SRREASNIPHDDIAVGPRRSTQLNHSKASPDIRESTMTISAQFARRGAHAPVKQQPIAPGAARLLAAIDDLAPELSARAGEIERVRRIPADITDRLLHMGLFRTLLPRSHGGLELSVPEVLPLVEALSAADSSVGWVASIGTVAQIFCTRVPRET